jgi:hypothetical protein
VDGVDGDVTSAVRPIGFIGASGGAIEPIVGAGTGCCAFGFIVGTGVAVFLGVGCGVAVAGF